MENKRKMRINVGNEGLELSVDRRQVALLSLAISGTKRTRYRINQLQRTFNKKFKV